ncbi:MAG: cupin domain-containing protein [Acidimicrobiia bacterium]|nr:cupin domain-containing protein [Acidimicrobiia bacterium]
MADTVVRNKGEGEQLWFLGGGVHTWKVLAEESDNSMLVFEDELEHAKVTPMHFHADVDEALYVIEGEILLNVEGTEQTVGAGGFTFAPRGRAHAFVVTSERARILCIQTPGSGQAFYRDASQPVGESGTGPVDFDRIRAAATATGATTIVGPPPFELASP